MAHDLRNSGLVQALTDLFADLADLLRKELQLAKTEITEKIVSRLLANTAASTSSKTAIRPNAPATTIQTLARRQSIDVALVSQPPGFF
jgi:septum formation inhibitor-activating ATPase MinD